MVNQLEIGRLLRAGTNGFVIGCRVSQFESPSFGGLVRVPLEKNYQVYGLIYDIRIDDDGLVRQLITTGGIDQAVIADNRENRNIPIEISVLTIGYRLDDQIWHLLPPRPPLSLDLIYLCDDAELREFTLTGRFGYFRHILRSNDISVGELLTAHVNQAKIAHLLVGNTKWLEEATKELIVLLRDDYPTLMSVLGTLSEVVAK